MKRIIFRPTSKFLRDIAILERASGRWDRLQSGLSSGEKLRSKALEREALASFALDPSSPRAFHLESPELLPRGQLELTQKEENLLQAYIDAYRNEAFVFSIEGIHNLAESLLRLEQESPSIFRQTSSKALAANYKNPREEALFPTIAPFLLEKRLSGIIEQTEKGLRGELHPIVAIGSFYLLFLQASPFFSANHRLASLFSWQLLRSLGYDFVLHRPVSPYFMLRNSAYLIALRRGEETAGGDWSTLGAWLEFFAESLAKGASSLVRETEMKVHDLRLTDAQRSILQVIGQGGAVSREHIVRETGIKLATVKYNLGVLTERGHLERHGGGRGTTYRIV